MWLTGKPSVAWYCIGKMFLTFWHLSKGSSIGHNWINIFDNHKKDFCLLISYLVSLCISISVVVPSGNSSICLGVEHCISKLQVVEECDTRNGLNPCRQHDSLLISAFNMNSLDLQCSVFHGRNFPISPVKSPKTNRELLQPGAWPATDFFKINEVTCNDLFSHVLDLWRNHYENNSTMYDLSYNVQS